MFESFWTNDAIITKDSRSYEGKKKEVWKKQQVIKVTFDIKCSQPYYSFSLTITPTRITSRMKRQIYGRLCYESDGRTDLATVTEQKKERRRISWSFWMCSAVQTCRQGGQYSWESRKSVVWASSVTEKMHANLQKEMQMEDLDSKDLCVLSMPNPFFHFSSCGTRMKSFFFFFFRPRGSRNHYPQWWCQGLLCNRTRR